MAKTKPELISEARELGLDASAVNDDMTVPQITDAIDRKRLLTQARERGVQADALPDDAATADIQKALDELGPSPEELAQKAADAAAARAGGDQGETFPVQRLIDEAIDFFDVPSHDAAGAFSGLDKDELTRAEGFAAIDAWRNGPLQKVTYGGVS